jgi:LPS O-antigen subunit length determinant protein (WzzB/FepE family)
VVYVLARDEGEAPDAKALSLVDLWHIVWDGKWIIVAATVLAACASIAYALLATVWYRTEVLMSSATSGPKPGVSGQLGNLAALGGLAALAGVNLDNDSIVEPMAVMESAGFTREFIKEQNLLPILFPEKWDAKHKRWKSDDPKKQPDLDDGVERFSERVRYLEEDRKTGLVRLRIEWTDPKLAAEWANLIVDRLNDQMRTRALTEAESNVKYLREVLSGESTVVLQQSIGRLLESELQKLMLARGKKEFSFQIIDRPTPPKWKIRPKRTQIVVAATLFGGLLGVFIVFVVHALRKDLQRSRLPANLAARS